MSESDRLTRIEEALGFAERATEELAAEVARLNRRLAEVVKTLESLEGRIEAASEEEDDGS